MNSVTFTEARTSLKSLLDRVESGEIVGISRRAETSAVLMSPAAYEDLQMKAGASERLADRIEDLEDLVAVLKHKIRPQPTLSVDDVRAIISQELASRDR